MTSPTKEELITWIDKASYEQLLRRNRFAAAGNIYFQGEVGKHYMEVMFKKKEEIGPVAATAISKNIGWER